MIIFLIRLDYMLKCMRCGGLVVSVLASIDRPSRVQILAWGLPTVRGGRSHFYTVQYMDSTNCNNT